MFKVLGGWFKGVSVRNAVAPVAGVILVFYVFLWRLGTLTPGLSPAEVAARTDSRSLHSIYANTTYAPHKLIQYMFTQSGQGGFIGLRLSSVVFAILFGFCFYKLAVSWFGRAIGLFGSLLFISLPLFVVASRQASPEIMLFSPIVLMWLYAWLNKKGSHKALVWLLIIVSAALLIYVPGMIWWMVVAFILCRTRIIDSISEVPAWITGAGLVLAAGILTPLTISLLRSPALIKDFALIPAQWAAPLQVAKNIGWMALALFIKTPGPNPLIIERLPILNVLLIALLVFGAYAMNGVAKSKAYLMGLSIVFGVLAAGINSNLIFLAFGLPAVLLFCSAGLRYLYIEWRSIFPRNPVPKTFALALIAVVTASQLYFGLRYSLMAWPHSDATRSTYVLK